MGGRSGRSRSHTHGGVPKVRSDGGLGAGGAGGRARVVRAPDPGAPVAAGLGGGAGAGHGGDALYLSGPPHRPACSSGGGNRRVGVDARPRQPRRRERGVVPQGGRGSLPGVLHTGLPALLHRKQCAREGGRRRHFGDSRGDDPVDRHPRLGRGAARALGVLRQPGHNLRLR